MAWYTKTKFYHHITRLTMWQMHPTRDMYTRLHPRYRPSALQLTETYPQIIDWCPFTALRNKLILLHASNPFLDQIICDIATAYVVETDLSELVALDKPTLGYVRVWDLIQAMGHESQSDMFHPVGGRGGVTKERDRAQGDTISGDVRLSGNQLPAPSSAELFARKEYASQAFRALRMDQGASLYLVDPVLFQKYPELYDPDARLMASGVSLAPEHRTTIPPPLPLQESTLDIYRQFADWALNVIVSSPTSAASL